MSLFVLLVPWNWPSSKIIWTDGNTMINFGLGCPDTSFSQIKNKYFSFGIRQYRVFHYSLEVALKSVKWFISYFLNKPTLKDIITCLSCSKNTYWQNLFPSKTRTFKPCRGSRFKSVRCSTSKVRWKHSSHPFQRLW